MDIEIAKESCKAYINAIDTFGTINYKCINNLYEPIETVLSELEKKDKIIDEMAGWIFDKDYTKNSLLIHRDDYYSNCIKQVKQYFTKKVEGK